VHGDLADPAGFQRVCDQGKALGFDGKTLIHPGQIETANTVFGVSSEDAAQAAEICAAWEAAAANGQSIAVLNDRMIEELHASAARRLLALHAAIRNRATGDEAE
jgi:citrate lyase subunit beta/citryl-CoA lyase